MAFDAGFQADEGKLVFLCSLALPVIVAAWETEGDEGQPVFDLSCFDSFQISPVEKQLLALPAIGRLERARRDTAAKDAGVTLFAVPTALGAETKHLPALAKSEEDFRLHYAPIAGWQLYNGMFDSKHTCKNVLLCALAEHCRSAISLATVTMAYERSARMMVVQDCATRNYIQKFKHQYIVLGA